jgi:hypothetical protein
LPHDLTAISKLPSSILSLCFSGRCDQTATRSPRSMANCASSNNNGPPNATRTSLSPNRAMLQQGERKHRRHGPSAEATRVSCQRDSLL